MDTFKVGYFVGSLAKGSINRKLARALVRLAPPELTFSEIAFCNSPLMNSVEAYVQFEPGLITDEGVVTRPETEKFLRNFITEFAGFVARVYTVLPRSS